MASRTSNKMLMAAVAGLLTVGAIGTATTARGEEGDKVKCYGVNSCKGTGACSGAGHGCAGKNACKGQGWDKVSSAKECTDKGGKVVKD